MGLQVPTRGPSRDRNTPPDTLAAGPITRPCRVYTGAAAACHGTVKSHQGSGHPSVRAKPAPRVAQPGGRVPGFRGRSTPSRETGSTASRPARTKSTSCRNRWRTAADGDAPPGPPPTPCPTPARHRPAVGPCAWTNALRAPISRVTTLPLLAEVLRAASSWLHNAVDARRPGDGSPLEDASAEQGAHRRNVTSTARNAASVETITIVI